MNNISKCISIIDMKSLSKIVLFYAIAFYVEKQFGEKYLWGEKIDMEMEMNFCEYGMDFISNSIANG